MGEIVLVRHGQANSRATSEAEYDRLSPLGHDQARWLGDWIDTHEGGFDRVHCGTLRRQQETTAGIRSGSTVEVPEVDARLNELDYFALSRDMEIQHGLPPPRKDDWPDHMAQTFAAWEAARIAGTEPFADFEGRIREMIAEAAVPGRRVLCVSSAGVIGTAVRLVLGLPVSSMAQLVLPIGHTSITRLRVRHDGAFLHSFNATPHLDAPNRAAARTTF